MKLFALLGLACLVSAHAAPTLEEKDLLVIPGKDGKTNLALLNVPEFKASVEDPYTEITFQLYTSSNGVDPIQIWVNNLNAAPFKPNRPTKFIIHGFTEDGSADWAHALKSEFLDAEDCNVIIVDWSGPAQGPLYNVAKANVEPTGVYVAQMYEFLNTYGHNVGYTHCIGHSLGAHVCGFSGKFASGILGRVTALDPARPLFDYDDPSSRLNVSDAGYVDVVHTCGGWLGFERPLGHADFYPNGGSDQPGCGWDLTGACSHARSNLFFGESVLSNNFVAKECASWDDFKDGLCSNGTEAIMGYQCGSETIGVFYLATSDNPPFALGLN